MKKTEAKSLFGELADFMRAKFFYNPIMKTTSQDIRLIWGGICEECNPRDSRFVRHYGSEKKRDTGEKVRYLNSRTQPCTPLQAYLLEYNFEYVRLNPVSLNSKA
jgi:hypothetical protein